MHTVEVEAGKTLEELQSWYLDEGHHCQTFASKQKSGQIPEYIMPQTCKLVEVHGKHAF